MLNKLKMDPIEEAEHSDDASSAVSKSSSASAGNRSRSRGGSSTSKPPLMKFISWRTPSSPKKSMGGSSSLDGSNSSDNDRKESFKYPPQLVIESNQSPSVDPSSFAIQLEIETKERADLLVPVAVGMPIASLDVPESDPRSNVTTALSSRLDPAGSIIPRSKALSASRVTDSVPVKSRPFLSRFNSFDDTDTSSPRGSANISFDFRRKKQPAGETPSISGSATAHEEKRVEEGRTVAVSPRRSGKTKFIVTESSDANDSGVDESNTSQSGLRVDVLLDATVANDGETLHDQATANDKVEIQSQTEEPSVETPKDRTPEVKVESLLAGTFEQSTNMPFHDLDSYSSSDAESSPSQTVNEIGVFPAVENANRPTIAEDADLPTQVEEHHMIAIDEALPSRTHGSSDREFEIDINVPLVMAPEETQESSRSERNSSSLASVPAALAVSEVAADQVTRRCTSAFDNESSISHQAESHIGLSEVSIRSGVSSSVSVSDNRLTEMQETAVKRLSFDHVTPVGETTTSLSGVPPPEGRSGWSAGRQDAQSEVSAALNLTPHGSGSVVVFSEELEDRNRVGKAEVNSSTDGSDWSKGERFGSLDDDLSVLPSVDGEEEVLSWRLDPDVSLSDWTVRVTNSTDNSVTVYHLHRNILAVGPRKSEYFVEMFKNRGKLGEAATDVRLPEPAAVAVPLLLDFVYSPQGKLELATETSAGLRHLAKLFGIRTLHKQVTQFIQRDLSLSNALLYYKDAVSLGDDKVAAWAARHCARNLLKIDPQNSLLGGMEPSFLALVLQSAELHENAGNKSGGFSVKKRSFHASALVASYFKLSQERLTEENFRMLANEKVLPFIDFKVALDLLELEADIAPIGRSFPTFSDITDLQKRCVKTLSTHWRELAQMDRDNVARVCQKLSGGVLTELLLKSLSRANRKVSSELSPSSQHPDAGSLDRPHNGVDSGEALDDREKRIRSECEKKLQETMKAHADDLAKLKSEYEADLGKMRDVCLDQDKQLARYRKEIQCFERLVNAPEGEIVQSGMLNGDTKMPIAANAAADGQFYQVQQTSSDGKVSTRKYPLFYFNSDKSNSC
jgi:BTB/POZ domain